MFYLGWRVTLRAATVVVLTNCLSLTLALPPSASGSPRQCRWDVSTFATGLGSLENLAFDNFGGMLLSRTTGGQGQLYRMSADRTGTMLARANAPGGIAVDGSIAYFTTGNSLPSALTGATDGTISAIDLLTNTVSTVAVGLTAPNGLARLPNGDFVVSRNLGYPPGLTRVSANGAITSRFAPELKFTNGLAFDSRRNALVVSVDFALLTAVALINVDNPSQTERIDLNLLRTNQFPDDLTIGSDGLIYLATDGGSIVRVDPSTHDSCTIASFQLLSTSVRFGAGPGWDENSLYATSLDGSIRKLTPRTAN